MGLEPRGSIMSCKRTTSDSVYRNTSTAVRPRQGRGYGHAVPPLQRRDSCCRLLANDGGTLETCARRAGGGGGPVPVRGGMALLAPARLYLSGPDREPRDLTTRARVARGSSIDRGRAGPSGDLPPRAIRFAD